MKTMLKLALVAAAAVAAFGAHAQDFPAKDKTVTIVVPFAAGTSSDLQARMIGERMAASLGQQGAVVADTLVLIGSAQVDDLGVACGLVAAMVEIIAHADDAFRGKIGSPI